MQNVTLTVQLFFAQLWNFFKDLLFRVWISLFVLIYLSIHCRVCSIVWNALNNVLPECRDEENNGTSVFYTKCRRYANLETLNFSIHIDFCLIRTGLKGTTWRNCQMKSWIFQFPWNFSLLIKYLWLVIRYCYVPLRIKERKINP